MIFNSNPTFTEKSTLSFYPESPVKRASRIPSGTPSTCDRDQKCSKQYCTPEKRDKNYQQFKYISPFSSFSDRQNEDLSPSITDRYIPSRKLLSYNSFQMQEEEQCNDQNQQQKEDPKNLTVSDVYRQYIMESPTKKQAEPSIQTFKNYNILKYGCGKYKQKLFAENNMISNPNTQFADQLASHTNSFRKVNKMPVKVLDAPALQEDYYLNLLDWSSENMLAVGLATSIYLWNGNNSKVVKLCELGLTNNVTSVGWSIKNHRLAIGGNNGQIQIWDVQKLKKQKIYRGHNNRVGSLAWNSSLLATGSRDKTILTRDLRSNRQYINKLTHHKQEVCGLKWSFDEQQLASGGNDNKLFIWNQHSDNPVLKFCDHSAAVKALAWSPHQHGLLVSGGGTADRTLRFRNTLIGETSKILDVGSQVCSLMFSKTLNQLISTHGYSHNQINIWKYPRMQKISTLTGHSSRVLYLAMSPDGSTIVTGAGDQTLRFWNVFPSEIQAQGKSQSRLKVDSIFVR